MSRGRHKAEMALKIEENRKLRELGIIRAPPEDDCIECYECQVI